MLFLAVLVIALGWAGWLWAWGRDRLMSNRGFGVAPGPLSGRAASVFEVPRTAFEARKRRRDVLVTLGIGSVITLLLALGGSSILWVFHLVIDVMLVAYGWAVFNVEQGVRTLEQEGVGPLSPLRTSPRLSFQPIVEDGFIPVQGPLRKPVSAR